MRFFLYIMLAQACTFTFLKPVKAGCGLEFCPVNHASSGTSSESISVALPVAIRVTGFNLNDNQGRYLENILGVQFKPIKGLTLQAKTSFVLLENNGKKERGINNALAAIEYGFLELKSIQFYAGTQFEIKLPKQPTSIAATHNEILPYGRMLWTAGNLFGDIRFGGRFSPSPHSDANKETDDGHSHSHNEDDEDDHTSLVVSPHSDQEIIYRASLGYAWLDHLFSTLIYTDGQIVMVEEDKGDVYLSSGFAAVLPLFDALHLRLDTQIPISAKKRFDWRSTVEAHLLF